MWTLDYDGAMLVRMDQSPEAFTSGGFYKLFLRRYVKEVLPGFVRFKPALSYLDFKKIIALSIICCTYSIRMNTTSSLTFP